MINDLYQSILEPRFVNHIQESKINTLNVNLFYAQAKEKRQQQASKSL